MYCIHLVEQTVKMAANWSAAAAAAAAEATGGGRKQRATASMCSSYTRTGSLNDIYVDFRLIIHSAECKHIESIKARLGRRRSGGQTQSCKRPPPPPPPYERSVSVFKAHLSQQSYRKT